MNAIGGVCQLDGAPLERAVVSRVSDAAELKLSYSRSSWLRGAVGFACASAQPENCFVSTGQVKKDGGRFSIVFDGRLDNRKELIGELCRHGVGTESRDVELTLAAYKVWGDHCASRLIGDFGFGLWDEARRRLLCVRDPLGVRPLYFLVRRGLLCFATQLRQVLAAVRKTPGFELEFIADRLAHGVDRADSDRTPYQGVRRLKPGHCLTADCGRVRIKRYWEWRVRGDRAPRHHREYLDQFHETFVEAVASRMRGAGSVWSDLSGGLDSSSIVSVAAQRRRSRLRTISVVFGESTLSDEREWAGAVAQAHGVQQHYIDGDLHHPLSRLREAVGYWEEPHAAAAFFGVHQQYGRLLAGADVPILLTGIGAEAVVMSKRQLPLHLADLLRLGRFVQLWRELNQWQRVRKMPLGNLAWQYCLRPLVSRSLVSHDWIPETHAWVDCSFARRWDFTARARYGGMPSTCCGVADQWQVEAIGRITGFLLRGYLEKACDLRYPFLHRPLVELALETPWSLKAVPGEPKALLRRAMVGLLPEEIRRRTQNASTDHAVYTGLRREWPALEQLVGSSMLVDLGVVNRERLHNGLHLARQGHAFNLGGLLSTLTLDAWLQNAAHKGDSACSSAVA